MKIKIKICVCAIAVFIFCLSNSLWAQGQMRAPDFTLTDLNNDSVSFSSYINKQPVMLFFWASWCPFCRVELIALSAIYDQLEREGIVLLAINVGESAAKVDNFSKKNNLPFRMFLDKDTTVTQSFGILGIPTYILIDKKGYIRFTEHYFPKKQYKSLLLK